MDEDSEAHFRAFAEARSGALLGTAYLLTGDPHRAQDLLQSALVKAYGHWGRIRAGGNAEPYVRRIMLNEQRSWWRARREFPVADVPDRAAVGGTRPDWPSGTRSGRRSSSWRRGPGPCWCCATGRTCARPRRPRSSTARSAA